MPVVRDYRAIGEKMSMVPEPQLVLKLYNDGYRWCEISGMVDAPLWAVHRAAHEIGLTVDRVFLGRWSIKSTVLPAGHPRTWNLINAGLPTLQDSKYGGAA